MALSGAACTGKNNPVSGGDAPRQPLASSVRVNDPSLSAQLVSGFYGVEENSWRWTAGKFSVLLQTPPGAAGNGATVTFAFTIPAVVTQKLGTITLSAMANGTVLKTQAYDKAGPAVFTADVQPSMLAADSIKIDFYLDKTFRPDRDKRDLGVVANSVGIVAK